MSIYRPLLCVTKAQIYQEASAQHLSYHEDSTNLDKTFTRNAIRHDVLPKLTALYPGALDNLQAFSDYFNQVQTVWDSLFLNLDKHVESYNDGFRFPLKEWQELTDFLKCEFLIRQLNSYYPNVNYSSHQIKRIVAASADQKGSRVFEVCEGVRCYLDQVYLILSSKSLTLRPFREGVYQLPLKLEGFDGFTLSLEKSFIDVNLMSSYSEKESVCFNEMCLDSNYIEIRYFEKGDRFWPFGMPKEQSLSDFFINQKIPVSERYGIPLLISKGACFMGHGYSCVRVC